VAVGFGAADTVVRAEDTLDSLQAKLSDLEAAFEEDIADVSDLYGVETLELTAKELRPRKGDIDVGTADSLYG